MMPSCVRLLFEAQAGVTIRPGVGHADLTGIYSQYVRLHFNCFKSSEGFGLNYEAVGSGLP